MALLSSGHFATDLASGSLPALLPLLRYKFALSYTLICVLVLAFQVTSSLIQPLFGLWSDRRGAMWLLPTGVALAGLGIALAADAPSYGLVVVFVVVSGLGIAAYHPEGSKFAAYVSGRRRASGMSLFSIGGNMGYGLGPLVTTAIVGAVGLRGGWLVAAPTFVVSAALLALGPLADRFGRRPVLLASVVATGPLVLVFVAVGGIAGAVALALVGACVVGTFGVTTVISQEYLPRHVGMASGLTVGFALGLGGLAALVLGRIADATSLRTALYVCVVAPVVAVVFGAF